MAASMFSAGSLWAPAPSWGSCLLCLSSLFTISGKPPASGSCSLYLELSKGQPPQEGTKPYLPSLSQKPLDKGERGGSPSERSNGEAEPMRGPSSNLAPW